MASLSSTVKEGARRFVWGNSYSGGAGWPACGTTRAWPCTAARARSCRDLRETWEDWRQEAARELKMGVVSTKGEKKVTQAVSIYSCREGGACSTH